MNILDNIIVWPLVAGTTYLSTGTDNYLGSEKMLACWHLKYDLRDECEISITSRR